MTGLVITFKSKKKNPESLWAMEYIQQSGDPAVEKFKELIPQYTKWKYESMPFVFDPDYNFSEDHTEQTVNVRVKDINSVPNLIPSTALYLFRVYSEEAAQKLGLTEFNAWRLQYTLDNHPYTVTVSTYDD